MEDLLRKCGQMASPVSACKEVRDKYCVIWPRELYCLTSGGGGGGGGGSVRIKTISLFFLIVHFF